MPQVCSGQVARQGRGGAGDPKVPKALRKRSGLEGETWVYFPGAALDRMGRGSVGTGACWGEEKKLPQTECHCRLQR